MFQALILFQSYMITVKKCFLLGNSTVNDVRLNNGQSQFEGVLEIELDGVWRNPCYYRFDQNEANVICRTLGKRYDAM